MTPSTRIARALEGLIRSIVRGDGGREFMNKNVHELAAGIDDLSIAIVAALGEHLSSEGSDD